jgi:hypothetical protein
MKTNAPALMTEWFFDPAYGEAAVKRLEKLPYLKRKIPAYIRTVFCRLQEQLAKDPSAGCAVYFEATVAIAYSVLGEPVWALLLVICERSDYQIKIWLGTEATIGAKATDIRSQLNAQLLLPGINALIIEHGFEGSLAQAKAPL